MIRRLAGKALTIYQRYDTIDESTNADPVEKGIESPPSAY